MIKQLHVREGNSGILYITDKTGKQERYIPDYDLDKARELLLEFQQLRDKKGRSIKDNYQKEGYYWFPTVVNYLYGEVFFRYVKYKPVIDKIIDGKLKVRFENKESFYNLVSLIEGKDKGSIFKKRIFSLLLSLNNKFVVGKNPVDLLFFKFTPNDFRTSAAKKTLDELKATYIEVIAPDKKLLLKNIIQRRPYYFYGGVAFKNIFGCEYNLDHAAKYKKILFAKAISKIEWMISAFVREYKKHCATLEGAKFKTFYGIDDTEIVYPMLYACQQKKIKTIAHQHGAAYNKRHASYIMEGIEKNVISGLKKFLFGANIGRIAF